MQSSFPTHPPTPHTHTHIHIHTHTHTKTPPTSCWARQKRFPNCRKSWRRCSHSLNKPKLRLRKPWSRSQRTLRYIQASLFCSFSLSCITQTYVIAKPWQVMALIQKLLLHSVAHIIMPATSSKIWLLRTVSDLCITKYHWSLNQRFVKLPPSRLSSLLPNVPPSLCDPDLPSFLFLFRLPMKQK